MLTPMLRATRSVAYRIRRSWKRNPNYRHGAYAKRRWRAESAIAKAMPRMMEIAQQMPKLGRLASHARELHAALMAEHPANWTLHDRSSGKILLPAREIGTAERWILGVRRLERLVRGMTLKRASWIALRINGFCDSRSDSRDTTRRASIALTSSQIKSAADELARYREHERRRLAVASTA